MFASVTPRVSVAQALGHWFVLEQRALGGAHHSLPVLRAQESVSSREAKRERDPVNLGRAEDFGGSPSGAAASRQLLQFSED